MADDEFNMFFEGPFYILIGEDAPWTYFDWGTDDKATAHPTQHTAMNVVQEALKGDDYYEEGMFKIAKADEAEQLTGTSPDVWVAP